jgi:dTMP kinase
VSGRFITFEGVDGAGKSTFLPWIADRLRANGRQVVVTREPGGTELGERLRSLVLKHPMHPETETLLMFAARQEHLIQVVRPALSEGQWVLCDRFTDATFAYQGAGRGVADSRIEVLERWVQQGLQPDLTVLFDVPVEIASARRLVERDADRFESEERDFHARVRQAYLRRAASEPRRIVVIDGSRSKVEVELQLSRIALFE